MNQDDPIWTPEDEIAAGAADLPGARTLLDSGELSCLLGERVTVTRVRLKAGHSLVVAFQRQNGEHRWAMLTRDPDKLAKAAQRAQDSGMPESLNVHEDHGPFLFSGDLWVDPALSKELQEARRAVDGAAGAQTPWTILRNNPRRRVVAVVPGHGSEHGEKVVRVASRGTSTALKTAARWRSLGLPVVRSTTLGRRGTAMSSPLWGWMDLSTSPHAPAALTAGEALGQLHRGTAGSQRRPLSVHPTRSAESAAQIAPWLANEIGVLQQRVRAGLAAIGPTPAAELHGDLSPDQVVLATPGSHKVRLIDFDRSGAGDPMRDVGSWIASCRRLGLEMLIEPFLRGYSRHCALDPTRLAVWEAYAQLTAATDPFRHRAPEWPAQMRRCLRLGEQSLHQAQLEETQTMEVLDR